MQLRIEMESDVTEEEVIIRCGALSERVQRIQQALSELDLQDQRFVFYKGETEYYLPLEEILFFETEDKSIGAHTLDDVYQVKYRLYELEDFLPKHFMRISKSTILNTDKVYAITRNLTASSVIEFQHTYKQVFVSRQYYKPLKNKLEEKRIKV